MATLNLGRRGRRAAFVAAGAILATLLPVVWLHVSASAAVRRVRHQWEAMRPPGIAHSTARRPSWYASPVLVNLRDAVLSLPFDTARRPMLEYLDDVNRARSDAAMPMPQVAQDFLLRQQGLIEQVRSTLLDSTDRGPDRANWSAVDLALSLDALRRMDEGDREGAIRSLAASLALMGRCDLGCLRRIRPQGEFFTGWLLQDHRAEILSSDVEHCLRVLEGPSEDYYFTLHAIDELAPWLTEMFLSAYRPLVVTPEVRRARARELEGALRQVETHRAAGACIPAEPAAFVLRSDGFLRGSRRTMPLGTIQSDWNPASLVLTRYFQAEVGHALGALTLAVVCAGRECAPPDDCPDWHVETTLRQGGGWRVNVVGSVADLPADLRPLTAYDISP